MKFSEVVKRFDEIGIPYNIVQEDDSYPNCIEILLPMGESKILLPNGENYYALIFDSISEELVDYNTYFKPNP